jgi:EAL domain-containing protein (putative c-di-GMP-specific phosphodiesterase class I)
MAEPELAWAVVSRLHGLGVQLAIDDFGIGYSSLAYLKRLPAGELKIDRSFVIDMVSEESDAVIVRSTIELGHNLGLQVVGEGVETRAAWDMLERFACDYAQGNYISAPLPPEHLTRLLPVVEWPFASELPAVRNFVEGLLNPPDS